MRAKANAGAVYNLSRKSESRTPAQSGLSQLTHPQRTFGNRRFRHLFKANGYRVQLQSELFVNDSGDVHEQEADRIANTVTGIRDSGAQACGCNKGACTKCGNEITGATRVQMKAHGISAAGATTAPTIVHEVLNSPGHPLDSTTRSF